MSYLDEFFDKRKALKKLTPEELKKEDDQRLADQRQKLINYKKFFGEPHGREVMLDLMNRFHVLAGNPGVDAISIARAEGQREVVLYLLSRANVSMEQLDKILKGEFV